MYISESEQISGFPLHFSVAPSCRSRDFKYREIANTFDYTRKKEEGKRLYFMRVTRNSN